MSIAGTDPSNLELVPCPIRNDKGHHFSGNLFNRIIKLHVHLEVSCRNCCQTDFWSKNKKGWKRLRNPQSFSNLSACVYMREVSMCVCVWICVCVWCVYVYVCACVCKFL